MVAASRAGCAPPAFLTSAAVPTAVAQEPPRSRPSGFGAGAALPLRMVLKDGVRLTWHLRMARRGRVAGQVLDP